jgi:hypothetical protein
VLSCWIVGATLIAGRWLWGLGRLHLYGRSCCPVGAEDVHDSLRTLGREMGVRGRVCCVRSGPGEPQAPMTWGVSPAVVALPHGSEVWPPERLRAVLLHELAHVARRDWLWRQVADVACAVFWFHPLVWWAANRISVESEAACDDRVLAAGMPASDYAQSLLEVIQSMNGKHSLPAVAMARGSRLERRIRAILAGRRRGAVTPVAAVATAILTAAVVVPVAGTRVTVRPLKTTPPVPSVATTQAVEVTQKPAIVTEEASRIEEHPADVLATTPEVEVTQERTEKREAEARKREAEARDKAVVIQQALAEQQERLAELNERQARRREEAPQLLISRLEQRLAELQEQMVTLNAQGGAQAAEELERAQKLRDEVAKRLQVEKSRRDDLESESRAEIAKARAQLEQAQAQLEQARADLERAREQLRRTLGDRDSDQLELRKRALGDVLERNRALKRRIDEKRSGDLFDPNEAAKIKEGFDKLLREKFDKADKQNPDKLDHEQIEKAVRNSLDKLKLEKLDRDAIDRAIHEKLETLERFRLEKLERDKVYKEKLDKLDKEKLEKDKGDKYKLKELDKARAEKLRQFGLEDADALKRDVYLKLKSRGADNDYRDLALESLKAAQAEQARARALYESQIKDAYRLLERRKADGGRDAEVQTLRDQLAKMQAERESLLVRIKQLEEELKRRER